jgi:gliding motility-associated-like protein
LKKFLILILAVFIMSLKAQVNAPSLRCIACNAAGDLKLTWVIPSDPLSQFLRYDIYRSNSASGPFAYNGSVATRTVNTFTDPSTGIGNTSSFYYFIKTISTVGASTVASNPSDTLRSIFLNLSGMGAGTAQLTYNDLHNPKLVTSGTNFDIYREHPTSVWSNIGNTASITYNDIISICNTFNNYQIQESDNFGCISSSNIKGGNFIDNNSPVTGPLDSASVNSLGESYLGWQPSPSKDCIGYVIFVQNSGGAWIATDTIYGINNTIYTYTNVTAGSSSVNFYVSPIDSCKNIGLPSIDHNTIYLASKYDICSRSAKLHWKHYKNLSGGILEYKVYGSVNSAPYTVLGTTTDTTFTQDNLTPGKNYCYYVRVVNNGETITSTSNIKCFMATAPPASSFAYLQSASVDFSLNIHVTIFADTTVACKGFNIYRSDDGLNFRNVAYMVYSGVSHYYYVDPLVSPRQQNYWYKAAVLDSCGNERYVSNIAKTVLLKVRNDETQIFKNNLSWDPYYTYAGGVAGYYIYRLVNDIPQTTSIAFVPSSLHTYTDNVEDIVDQSGKVGYYVQAAENFGNPYGISATANSNVADAYVEAQIFTPNAFTPEGENREWLPKAQFVEKSEYHVKVFDRWGHKVWETSSDTEGWNGSGKEQGTYAYLIQYKNARGEYIEQKGSVTMIR